MRNRFILSIMFPLIMVTILCFILGCNNIAIFFGLLSLDGFFGLIRNEKRLGGFKDFKTSDLKIIKNKILPFGKKYVAFVLFGIVFTKRDVDAKLLNHEIIHVGQAYETGYFLFYFIYLLEGLFWTIKLFILLPRCITDKKIGERLFERLQKAITYCYKHICFDQEAHAGDIYDNYVNKRTDYAWLPYLFNDDDLNVKLDYHE